MLFSQERVRLKITHSKIALTVHRVQYAVFPRKKKLQVTHSKLALMVRRVQCSLPKKSKTENHPDENNVNGTQGTVLFSQERVRIKINESKIALTVPSVQC